MVENTSVWSTFTDSFDIGIRVVKWDEPDGLNFIPTGKYRKRNVSHVELQKIIKQFTIHWSVTYTPHNMFTGLKARGLSCNLMIGDDIDKNGYATIYQNLPIMYSGWSQGTNMNDLGPGVEISYMPQAWEDASLYSDYNCKRWGVQKHKTTTASVHGTKLKVFLPTDAQIKSLKRLIWGFSELFPNVPMTFPRDDKGNYITTVLKDPLKYTGLANHYNLKRSKIDTAGLDLKNIEEDVAAMKKWGY